VNKCFERGFYFMNLRKSTLLFIFVALWLIPGCYASNITPSLNTTTPKVETTKDPMEIVTAAEFKNTNYSRYIEGTLKNVSGHDLSYVSVKFSIEDSTGNKIGTALDSISDIPAGGTWKYSAHIFEKGTIYCNMIPKITAW
jgi:hypothetical protein